MPWYPRRPRPAVPSPPPFPLRVLLWLADEDGGGGFFLGHGDGVRAHDPSCASLPGVWMPRRGGFSDLCELEDCPGCGVTFLIDAPGLHFEPDSVQLFLADGDEDWYDGYWCDCCWLRRSKA